MKILMISPCHDPAYKRPKNLLIPQLALHILKGLTPADHTVEIVEEERCDIDLDQECDLAAISCLTANAPRAYWLADQFRSRGVSVVLGGVHPTLLPDEALQHADAVVIGEAEGVWETLLGDFGEGRMQRTYHHPEVSLDRYVCTKSKAINPNRFSDYIPILTSRGCPYSCDFCSVGDIYGKKIRHSPVENVVRDITESGRGRHRFFGFLDDNIVGDPGYAKQLFRALKPLGIRWMAASSIAFVNNAELLRLAAESGCIMLFVGLESVVERNLRSMPKLPQNVPDVEEAIRKLRDSGILFYASLIFGRDDDDRSIFPETLEFLHRNQVSAVSFNVLTPFPGTKVFEQLDAEDRLLTRDWKYYDTDTVVYKPKKLSPLELQAGLLWMKKEFYKMSSTVRRLRWNLDHPFLYLAFNAGCNQTYRNDLAKYPRKAGELFNLDPPPDWHQSLHELYGQFGGASQ